MRQQITGSNTDISGSFLFLSSDKQLPSTTYFRNITATELKKRLDTQDEYF